MVKTYVKANFDIETTVTKVVLAPNFLPIPKENGNPIHLDITAAELPEILNIRALPGSGLIYTNPNFNDCPLSELSIDFTGNPDFESVTELLFEFVSTSGVSRIGELKLFGKPEYNLDTQVDTIDDLTGTVVNLDAQDLINGNTILYGGDTTGTRIEESSFLNSPYVEVAGQLDNVDFANIQSATGFYMGFLMESNMEYNAAGNRFIRQIFLLMERLSDTGNSFRIDLDKDGNYVRLQTNNTNHIETESGINTLGDFVPKPLPLHKWHFYEFNYDRVNNIMYIYVDGALHDVWNNTVPAITYNVERLRLNNLENASNRKIARFVGLGRFASNEDRKAVLKTIDSTDGLPIFRTRDSLDLSAPIVLNQGFDRQSYSTTSLVALANKVLTTPELNALQNIIDRYKELLNKNLSEYYDSLADTTLPCSHKLVLWLSADRGKLYSGYNNGVETWIDYSPRRNHARSPKLQDGVNQALPVELEDAQLYFNLDLGTTLKSVLRGDKLVPTDRGKRTVFIVSKRKVVSSSTNALFTIGYNVDETVQNDTTFRFLEQDLGNGDVRVLVNQSASQTITADITDDGDFLTERHVSCWRIDNKSLEYFVNGVQKVITSLSAPLIGDSMTGYTVGSPNSADNSNSGLYEILVFADLLDTSEISTISNALLTKPPVANVDTQLINFVNSQRLIPEQIGSGWFDSDPVQSVPWARVNASGLTDDREYLASSSENISLEFWFFCPKQFTLAGSVADMVGVPNGNSSNDALRIFMSSNNVGIRVRHSGNGTQDLYTGAIVGEGWHHFVWTRNGRVMTMYLDGVQRNQLEFSSSFTGLSRGSNSVYVLGKRPDLNSNSSFFYNGRIANLKKWGNRVLTPEQVAELYNNPIPYQNEITSWFDFAIPFRSLSGDNWSLVLNGTGRQQNAPGISTLKYTASELGGITYGYFTETNTVVNTLCDLQGLNNTVINRSTTLSRTPRSNGTIFQKDLSSQTTLDWLATLVVPSTLDEIFYFNGQTDNFVSANNVATIEIYSDSGFSNLLYSFSASASEDGDIEDTSGVTALQTPRDEYYFRFISSGASNFVSMLNVELRGTRDLSGI